MLYVSAYLVALQGICLVTIVRNKNLLAHIDI